MSGNGRLVAGEGLTLVGNITTLTHGFKIKLAINGQYRERDPSSPKYEIFVAGKNGEVKCGLAWEKTAKTGQLQGKKFLSLMLDDPSFDAPLNVTAFPDDSGTGFDIAWRRPRRGRVDAATGEVVDDEIPF